MTSELALEASFLNDSISDIQATIRQVDAKVGFLVFFTVYPAFHLPNLVSNYNDLTVSCFLLNGLLFAVFFLWLLGIFATIRTLMPVVAFEDQSVERNLRLFSGPAGNKLSFLDLVFNDPSKSSRYEAFLVSELRQRPENIIESLLSEQARLSYVRDIKIYRSKFALHVFGLWLSLGLLIWVAVLAGK